MSKWNIKAKQQQAMKDIRRQSAVIDSIRIGKIAKAEDLTGTELIKRDPILESLSRREHTEQVEREAARTAERDRQNQAIVDQLRAISARKPLTLEDLMSLRRDPEMLGDVDPVEELLGPDVTDVTPEFPEELPNRQDSIISDIPRINQTIYPKEELDKVDNIDELVVYLDKLRDNKRGYKAKLTGHGNHLIKNKARHRKNLENLNMYIKYIDSRIKYLKRVQGYDRGTASPIVEDPVEEMGEMLAPMLKDTPQKQQGNAILTTMEDISERLKILVGEITSGNTNVKLKNELADILHYLLRKGEISKSKYKTLMDLVI